MKERKLGDLVHEARLEKKLSLRKAANAMEFSAMYLSQIEAGKNKPSDKILRRLSEFYDLDFVDLIRASNESAVDIDEEEYELRNRAARRLYSMSSEEFDEIVSKILIKTKANGGD